MNWLHSTSHAIVTMLTVTKVRVLTKRYDTRRDVFPGRTAVRNNALVERRHRPTLQNVRESVDLRTHVQRGKRQVA